MINDNVEDIFTVYSIDVFTPLFEGPAFDLPTEENSSKDTIKDFDDSKDLILNMLGEDEKAFHTWLHTWLKTSNSADIKITVNLIELLASCWQASKQHKNIKYN